MQEELDHENPECVLDGLILQQMKEYQTLGQPVNFTDEILGALVANVFIGSKYVAKIVPWNSR